MSSIIFAGLFLSCSPIVGLAGPVVRHFELQDYIVVNDPAHRNRGRIALADFSTIVRESCNKMG